MSAGSCTVLVTVQVYENDHILVVVSETDYNARQFIIRAMYVLAWMMCSTAGHTACQDRVGHAYHSREGLAAKMSPRPSY